MYAPTLNVGRPARSFVQGDPSSHSSQEAFWEEELRLKVFPCFCCNSESIRTQAGKGEGVGWGDRYE